MNRRKEEESEEQRGRRAQQEREEHAVLVAQIKVDERTREFQARRKKEEQLAGEVTMKAKQEERETRGPEVDPNRKPSRTEGRKVINVREATRNVTTDYVRGGREVGVHKDKIAGSHTHGKR